MNSRTECTLSDDELLEQCTIWVSRLCQTGGNAWSLSVPVNFNSDPDMLFLELIKRFRESNLPIIDEL